MLRLLALLPLLLLQGCSDSPGDSDDFSNASIFAEFEAISTGFDQSVEIRATLYESTTLANLWLTGDDELLASNGYLIGDELWLDGDLFSGTVEVSDSVLRMSERYLDGRYSYFTIFQEPQRSLPFYVSFLRDVDSSVSDVPVAFPPAFEIDTPVWNSAIPRTEDVQLAWLPPNGEPTDEMVLKISATCGETEHYENTIDPVADDGLRAVTTDEIFGAGTPAGICQVALALERTRYRGASASGTNVSVKGTEKRVVVFQSID